MHAAATTPPKLATLVLLSGLSVLTLNMFLPSLSNMAADFGTDYSIVSLSIAGYLAVTAAMQLVIGPLSDRFGRRPVLLSALAVFTLASLGCLLATNIWVFLGFRMMQGAVIAGWALSLAIIRDTVPAQQAAGRIGTVAMAMAVAPMLGPVLGGWLDLLFGWRASFVVYLGAGAAVLVLCWIDLGETNRAPSSSFRGQFRAYPQVLRSPLFWGYALCMAFSVGAFHAFLTGAPLVTKALFGMPPETLGVYLGSITAGFMFGNFVSSRIAQRYALTTMMIAGRLVACGGLLAGLALVAAGIVTVPTLFGATLFVGIGNGLTMPSSSAGAMSVRPDLAGSAAGLAGALTVGGGAVMTSLAGTLVTESNAGYGLLGLMLASSFAGLIAALAVWRAERRALAPSV